ncbi:hypothetical protein ACO0LC_18475 [Undibacterium sp. JH2W]|uniref:hypothetical protein n=1 Tax=Undibacterium sp. JH2W TaxID=3413037 RepID=UPI003BF2068C
MTIFELVKIALDELYAEGRKRYGDKLDAEILEKVKYLKNSYTLLNDSRRIPVDYEDPATRFAYVYKYVAAHGDYVAQLLQKLKSARGGKAFDGEVLRVSCIGGGPGSDIIGILKYLADYSGAETITKVVCYLLDKEQAWADSWTELDSGLQLDIQLNVNFQKMDVTDPVSWSSQTKFLQADLFTLSYFVSEIKALDERGALDKFWQSLMSEAKPGALFLYDDNGHTDFTDYFDAKWKAAGFHCILATDNFAITPQTDEQASSLNEYKSKFGDWPKLRSQLTFRILQKPTN